MRLQCEPYLVSDAPIFTVLGIDASLMGFAGDFFPMELELSQLDILLAFIMSIFVVSTFCYR
jgi:hypothetical protein